MYYAEWIFWLTNIKPDDWFEKNAGEHKHSGASVAEPIYEAEIEDDLRKQTEKQFPFAKTRGPVYACNDTYLEMRCGGMENRRGFITLVSLVFMYLICRGWLSSSGTILSGLLSGAGEVYGRPIGWNQYFDLLFDAVVFGVPLWAYLRYGLRFSRLEMLTTRHLLVRFNRVTRQVYLHRPRTCGDILVLPWEGVCTEEVPGTPLYLTWFPGAHTSLPFPTGVFVGKLSSDQADLEAEWEFIRRYMDEGGLAAVPKPRISSQLPLPWPAFTAQFEALGPFLRNAGPLVWLGCLLISPAFLILGLSHWASLLLCWRPRWPKVIREAGQPGKPVPAFTTVTDYPPDVQAKLLANAHRWIPRPGRAPEKLRRGRRR